ncbi:Uncharacterised protein [Mycobacterium tuberculosis]|nr:Uncharacterised protein [Mycobacterium tuberculosis]CNN25613.1 Uncharacterised protein [Mycobacterium tuberculosis]
MCRCAYRLKLHAERVSQVSLMPNGLPSVITWRTADGWSRARPRAKMPPRLHPIRLTGVWYREWSLSRRSRIPDTALAVGPMLRPSPQP